MSLTTRTSETIHLYSQYIGKIGVVQDFTTNGDVVVEYRDIRWRYNPAVLSKVMLTQSFVSPRASSNELTIFVLWSSPNFFFDCHKHWHQVCWNEWLGSWMIKKYPTEVTYVKIYMVRLKLKHWQCVKFLMAHNKRHVITNNLKHHHSINWPTGISDMEWDRKHYKS